MIFSLCSMATAAATSSASRSSSGASGLQSIKSGEVLNSSVASEGADLSLPSAAPPLAALRLSASCRAQLQKPGRCKMLAVEPGLVGKIGFEQRSHTSFSTVGVSFSPLKSRYRVQGPQVVTIQLWLCHLSQRKPQTWDPAHCNYLSAEDAVAGITQSGHDITELRLALVVNRPGSDVHIRMFFVDAFDPFRSGDKGKPVELFCTCQFDKQINRRDRRTAGG